MIHQRLLAASIAIGACAGILAVGVFGGGAPARAQEGTFDLPGAATPAPPRPDIEGVVFVDVWSAQHTQGPVEYEVDPPAGGPHNPVWQACGVYDTAVPKERVVHSQEHGAVWIAYGDELPEADLAVLKDLAAESDYILLSPYEGLEHPLAAAAWGALLPLDSATDPRLEAFIDFYANSPDGPEYGAPCAGSGTDETTPIDFPAGATPIAQPPANESATPTP